MKPESKANITSCEDLCQISQSESQQGISMNTVSTCGTLSFRNQQQTSMQTCTQLDCRTNQRQEQLQFPVKPQSLRTSFESFQFIQTSPKQFNQSEENSSATCKQQQKEIIEYQKTESDFTNFIEFKEINTQLSQLHENNSSSALQITNPDQLLSKPQLSRMILIDDASSIKPMIDQNSPLDERMGQLEDFVGSFEDFEEEEEGEDEEDQILNQYQDLQEKQNMDVEAEQVSSERKKLLLQKIVERTKELWVGEETASQDDKYLLELYLNIDKNNINKNILASFQKYILQVGDTVVVESMDAKEKELYTIRKELKNFTRMKKFNNKLINSYFNSERYKNQFQYYLQIYAIDYFQKSKVVDKDNHYICIAFLIRCFFQPQLRQHIITYNKSKYFRKSIRKPKKSSNQNEKTIESLE